MPSAWKNFPERCDLDLSPGAFYLVTFPAGISARRLLLKAIERKVAYVDGAGFYVNDNGKNTARFAYSEAEPQKIKDGIAILGELLHEELDKQKRHASGSF